MRIRSSSSCRVQASDDSTGACIDLYVGVGTSAGVGVEVGFVDRVLDHFL